MSISSDFLFHYTPSTTCQILWSSKSLPDPKCVKGYSNTTQTNLATLDAYLLHTFSLECITKWILEIFEYFTKLGGLLFCHYVCVYAHAAHGTDHNIQSLHYSSSQLWPLWNPLTFCLSLWNAVSMFMLPYEQCINQTQQYDSITMQYNAQKMQSTILCSIIALNISLTLKAYLILSSACLTFPRQLSNTSIVLLSPGKSSRDHSHSLIQLLETKMLINQYASVIIRRMLTGNHVAKFVWDMAVSDSIRCIIKSSDSAPTAYMQTFISYSHHAIRCLGLSPVIFLYLILAMCLSRKSRKNSRKTCFARSRSSILVPPQTLMSSACYEKQQVCVYLEPYSH